MSNDITLPLKVIGNNVIGDFNGNPLAKVLVETDVHEFCEYFAESINQSTILILENEELNKTIEKLTGVLDNISLITANSEELVEAVDESLKNAKSQNVQIADELEKGKINSVKGKIRVSELEAALTKSIAMIENLNGDPEKVAELRKVLSDR